MLLHKAFDTLAHLKPGNVYKEVHHDVIDKILDKVNDVKQFADDVGVIPPPPPSFSQP